MKDIILVVGGYGHVGRTICQELGTKYPGKVVAAGRSRERAEQFSREMGGKVRPLRLNLQEPVDSQVLKDVKLVIMCLDQTDTTFVRACLHSGAHYVDVSANGQFLLQAERWDDEAKANGGTAVLSVGLAPGLTNLLAAHAVSQLDRTDSIDIGIMLGMGDQHGQAAIEWTVDHMGQRFEVIENYLRKNVNSFSGGRRTDFGPLGRKRAYRFPFSDQQTLVRTLEVPTVSTRLCFDSAVMTGLLAGLRIIGVFKLMKWRWARNLTVRAFSRVHFGEEKFAIKIDAHGRKNGDEVTIQHFLQGLHQSVMTAKVAVSVADAMYRKNYPSGVYHMEQLFGLRDIAWLEHETELVLGDA